MSKYFAHTRRKVKPKGLCAARAHVSVSEARENEVAAQREMTLLELKRARAEKEERARARIARKRECVDLDRSARRRTAVHSAGLVVISATAGLHTHGISVFRPAGGAACGLWGAKIEFGVESDFTYYFDDPATPADSDALHAMRALAPGVAERLAIGQAYADGADDNNMRTAFRLAESFMRKTYCVWSLSAGDLRRLSEAIFNDFQAVVEQRLRHFQIELDRIVTALMDRPKISRGECAVILAKAYEGFDEYYRGRSKPLLFRPPRPQLAESRQTVSLALACRS
jgi:hypothetical protein